MDAGEAITLDVIRLHAPLARAALARMLGVRGVRPASADDIVAKLLRRGVVHLDCNGFLTVREQP